MLSKTGDTFLKIHGSDNATELFKASHWHTLATLLAENCRETLETIQLMTIGPKAQGNGLVVTGRSGAPLVLYLSEGPDLGRFVDRCALSGDDALVPRRADILAHLTQMTLSGDERMLRDKGLKTARQTFEGNFWYRFAYHGFREWGRHGCVLHPVIEEGSGDFMLSGRDADQKTLFYLPVPRLKVKRLLAALGGAMSNAHGLHVQPLSLDAVFDVHFTKNLDLEITPLLRMIQQNGQHRFFKREDIERFRYGDLYYIKEVGLLVEDHYPAPPPEFVDSVQTVIARSRVPQFLAEHRVDLQQQMFLLDTTVQERKIMTVFTDIEITAEAAERNWCWLSVLYGDGNQRISLAAILRAKKEKQRFVATEKGWVDCDAPAFDALNDLVSRSDAILRVDRDTGIKLSQADLLRLSAMEGKLSLGGDNEATARLRSLLALQPRTCPPAAQGLLSTLRSYQESGVQWLWFLYENGLSGLLCDDMGLGKTHQIMAFLLGLREGEHTSKPFLVVCPTSVISHWQQKIAHHAPGLGVQVYYGGGRDLTQALTAADVIVTSYGLLRRDIAALLPVAFGVVVFDEIHAIKNADTATYKAAQDLRADMKIGLTGTPIQNNLSEIKSLMDIAMPGYLGPDDRFTYRFSAVKDPHSDGAARQFLHRLIFPFTLRRLKKSVLHELPDKIEDNRTCQLSDDQVKLYRDAIARRGVELHRALANENEPVPYMHIFALLNLLKQICNHPAQVEKDVRRYDQYASGKWDLFTELLAESLDSGQKVVVYSQYAIMIEIISHYLAEQQVDFVTLTGASRKRGDIVDRFNGDPLCRVFVGSLKAGGEGIDLVAASVVIHYDRWWNAAREDQATDRVHRIGQTRGVQVFKLITEGTLEEKIAAMISRKRELMESIVQEDDPSLVKTFSRDELLALIAPLEDV